MLFGLDKLFPPRRVESRVELADGLTVAKEAATSLPPIVPPKVTNVQQSVDSFSKRAKTATGDQRLVHLDRRTANLDLLSLRNGASTWATIHDLAQVSPDLSASVFAHQRMVVTRDFSAVARNEDSTINPEATAALQAVISRFNYLQDFTMGPAGMQSIHSVAEALTKELRLYGSCSLELVLDKARLPSRLQPISVTQLSFMETATGEAYPEQRIRGLVIPLNIPAFFYESLDQDLLQAYSDSPLESSLQAVLADTEFHNDVRRTVKRALHPRFQAMIDFEKFRESMPIELAGDNEAAAAYQAAFIASIQSTVNDLDVDDALIAFNAVEFSYLNNGNVSLGAEWQVLQDLNNAKMATGAKTPAAVLGHGGASANIASTEAMLFARACEGTQNKVNSIISRAMTLAVRLLGYDVYCVFAFDRVDLRPDSELEAFRSIRQSRILEQLSIGMISDLEASLQLTGRLPAAGAPVLQGTFFKTGSTDPNAAAPLSNTGSAATNTATPTQTKGSKPADATQKPAAPAAPVPPNKKTPPKAKLP